MSGSNRDNQIENPMIGPPTTVCLQHCSIGIAEIKAHTTGLGCVKIQKLLTNVTHLLLIRRGGL